MHGRGLVAVAKSRQSDYRRRRTAVTTPAYDKDITALLVAILTAIIGAIKNKAMA